MLRIDNQRARSREAEPRSDRGFSPSQRRDPLRGRNPSAGVSVDRAASAPAAVHAARPQGTRLAATVRGEDDGVEPGTGDAPDRPLSGPGRDPAGWLPAHRFPQRYTRGDIELLAAVD